MKTTDFFPLRRGTPGKPSLRSWSLAAALAALMLAVAVSPCVAGSPHSAVYSTANDQIFWFIHASDLHVGTGGTTESTNLQWLVTTAKSTIKPSFIVVTGDLTDSTNGNLFGYPNGPYQAEWSEYRGIVDAYVTADMYYDIPGNHDAYNDANFAYYAANSVQGRAMSGNKQHSWTRTFPFGTYHFLGVNTADNSGAPFSIFSPYGDYAGLDSSELTFIASSLQANQGAKLTMVFGHHPLAPTGNSQDTYLYYGKDQFVGYMNTYRASLYGYGHTHASGESFYSASMTEGVFYFNVSSLGKGTPYQYTLTAVDCNGIASVTQSIGTWPVVLITAPMDKNLGKNVNPYTYSVTNSATNPIRALVFDTASVSQVQYRVDGGAWFPMQRPAATNPNYDYLWEALWNATALASGEHTIEVQATTASGVRTDSVKVNMQATQPQQKAGVVTLITGKYPKRSTTLTPTGSFAPGDSIVFRATIKNAGGQPVAGATARIAVTGKQNVTVLTGPSNADGVSEGIWKTSAPSRKSAGTPLGTYTGTVSGVTASGYVWDGVAKTVTVELK